jgi:hypothetical protein
MIILYVFVKRNRFIIHLYIQALPGLRDLQRKPQFWQIASVRVLDFTFVLVKSGNDKNQADRNYRKQDPQQPAKTAPVTVFNCRDRLNMNVSAPAARAYHKITPYIPAAENGFISSIPTYNTSD